MGGRPYIPILSQFEEYRGRRRSVGVLELPENEIQTPSVSFHVPPWGYYLNMPPCTVAVISSSAGETQVYQRGGMVELEPGEYTIQFIDFRRRYTSLRAVKARSRDAWEVSLSVEISWRVSDPLEIIGTRKASTELINLARGAIMNYISENEHDDLVVVPFSRPISDENITKDILDKLKNHPNLKGFHFIHVDILERLGDPERLKDFREFHFRENQNDIGQINSLHELNQEFLKLTNTIDTLREQIDQMKNNNLNDADEIMELTLKILNVFRNYVEIAYQADKTLGGIRYPDLKDLDTLLVGLDKLPRSLIKNNKAGNRESQELQADEMYGTQGDSDTEVLPAMDLDHLE